MSYTVVFDFGGVIADEGWAKGVRHIAELNNYEPENFFKEWCELLLEVGYMLGNGTEEEWWTAVHERYEVKNSTNEMRDIIFERFKIRPEVIEMIKSIKKSGYKLAILSDQVNWLDEFNEKHGFFELFDVVYNSYHTGDCKNNLQYFKDIAKELGDNPEELIFVDDNAGHIGRAEEAGWKAVHYTDFETVKETLKTYIEF